MELRNPFAMYKGRVITIYDLDESSRGLKCDCSCPVCGGVFEAKMGEIRQWHFAHSGEPCDRTKQYVNSTFMLVRQLLIEKGTLSYPGYQTNGRQVFDSGIFVVKEAEIKYRNDGMAEALVLNDNQLALRIALDMEYCAGGIYSAVGDTSTMLIDLTQIMGITTEGLSERICSNLSNKEWIYSKRVARLPRKGSTVLNAHELNIEEEGTEDTWKTTKTSEYIPHLVKCRICKRRVNKEDAIWGRYTQGYYCHKCIESKGLDWKEL